MSRNTGTGPDPYVAPQPEVKHVDTEKGESRWNRSLEILSNVKKFEENYEQFHSRNASEAHLVYADGDMPQNKFAKVYNYLINVSIVTRWVLFIVPVLAILWIPGILSLTSFPNAKVWGVRLLWWSIWLSVFWAGWWCALAVARFLPHVAKSTIGVVAVASRRYIDWLQALHRYIALFAWTLTIWVTWTPILTVHQTGAGQRSVNAINLIARILFAFFLCSGLLLFEKLAIHVIATKFHERSYAERIADQAYAVKSLVVLYRHSSDIPGRTDTLKSSGFSSTVNPRRLLKKFRNGVRIAATTTTSALGNVASEIAGSSVLQPNSPQAMVKTALQSANKSRLLARRLFYSFVKGNADTLLVDDIRHFFTPEEAEVVFSLFDKDSNGDVSRDEFESTCLEFHREEVSLEHSMRDLDSAVARLDSILMSLYVIAALLIVAVALQAQLVTLVTGAGTLILGLSWLIGGSLQEVLTSIIFLFVKHPFDVGDKIVVNKETYTVKDIHLLSSVFLDSSSVQVQVANSVLNTLFIQNMRRSPQMTERFTFDVSYSTTFHDIEKLRDVMLKFLNTERRDFYPVFDIFVQDFPNQEKMTLGVDIKYKSNGQEIAIKAKRRNKWICALKMALAEVKIFGTSGDPGAPLPTARYTKVPWALIDAKDREDEAARAQQQEFHDPTQNWQESSMPDSPDAYNRGPLRGLPPVPPPPVPLGPVLNALSS